MAVRTLMLSPASFSTCVRVPEILRCVSISRSCCKSPFLRAQTILPVEQAAEMRRIGKAKIESYTRNRQISSFGVAQPACGLLQPLPKNIARWGVADRAKHAIERAARNADRVANIVRLQSYIA